MYMIFIFLTSCILNNSRPFLKVISDAGDDKFNGLLPGKDSTGSPVLHNIFFASNINNKYFGFWDKGNQPLRNFILTYNIYPNFRLQCLGVSSTSNNVQINLIVFTGQCFTAVHKLRPIRKITCHSMWNMS